MSTEQRKRGRQAEAERNNVRILEAAREVFIANPAAPISQVALRAGVGIAALYHRYPSKNALLAQLCLDGQDTYIELVEQALASTDDLDCIRQVAARHRCRRHARADGPSRRALHTG